ncbi:hypothetical protein PIN31115_01658 [Pandoraea iniqua]|uniref:Uncharacterized protein n=1 Tax=Pandoraea iniqua TaxID=2508288 RepID=A0A5E4TW87_9BURK|nr:hypothetical protein [Pandoraea iniqua]VVD92226.1 hypothetical protein PIN31115_01658 [Pandoraea iniqua]
MKILTAPLCCAAVSVLPALAFAADFSIRNDPDTRVSFVVECRDRSGKSGSNEITLQPGQRMDIGDPGCRTFTASISTDNGTRSGRIKTYTLDAGHSYYVFWNDRYWDIAEEE